MILAGNTLYAGGDDKVAAFDISDGSLIWNSSVTGKALGLAVAGGKLYVSTDRGLLYAFTEPTAGKQSQFKVK